MVPEQFDNFNQLILTCDLQMSCGPLRPPNPIGHLVTIIIIIKTIITLDYADIIILSRDCDNVDHLTDVGPGIIRLDGVEDEVARPLDCDAALETGHRQDGRVVPIPDNVI